jgi:MoaD family protein
MHVTVNYMAQVKRAAGTASEAVELAAGSTVGALVSQVAEQHGEEFKKLVLNDDGTVRRTILLFVGEDQITRKEIDRELADGQEITFVSPVAGG